MAADFEIKNEQRDDGGRSVSIVRVQGEVDLAYADDLQKALLAEGCRKSDGVLLDMSVLEFMDSSGLRSVLIAAEELECPMVLVASPGSSVERLLSLAEIDGRLQSFPDEAAALAGLTALTKDA